MTARRHRAQGVDRRVGARVRDLRVVAGLSQGMLGELIGVTYQQQAKYESGVNQISASQLFALATALDRDVGEFFEGLEAPVAPATLSNNGKGSISRELSAIAAAPHRQLLLRMAAVLAGATTEYDAAEAARAGGTRP